ncbi:hypothetical protein [Psychrobacillus sp. BM2]|uniref:hypothetical protein n=1 Tax=Psychrobacillus sp. BM2 TaxID=3400421 RepID=UPI003B02BE6C
MRGGSTCRVIGVGLLALEVDLLAEGLGLLALEEDLLTEPGWVLALSHRLLAVGGCILAVRDYLEALMLLAFRRGEKLPFWVLLAERMSLLALEEDLLTDPGWVLALD